MKEKEEEKEKEKMKGNIIAAALNASELNSFDNIYGNLVKEPGKSLTDEEVIKLGDEYLTSEKMLHLFSKNPEEAYKELIAAHKFDDGMFIKLIVYEEICSKGKFTFNNTEYLLHLAKNGSFNLKDPMLLAYAVRLGDQGLALQVTKELVKKGAVIADNILFHSYNNPDITKFLLMEKLSIITYQDKFTGTDSVIKKLQTKISQSTSETEQHKFQTTLELLKAAKTGGEDLNIKLDIICPPIFDNKCSENLFKEYAVAYQHYGKAGLNLYNNKIYLDIEKIIKAGGNLKRISKEFEDYAHKCSSPEIVKLLFKESIPQDVSSTASTTTTSVSTTSSLGKSFTSASSSSTSSPSSSSSFLGDDSVTTSSLLTLPSSTTIESISDVSLAGGDSSPTDAA